MRAQSPESVQSEAEQSSEVVSPFRDDDSPATKRMKSFHFGLDEEICRKSSFAVFF